MIKKCTVCQKDIAKGDMVVALLLARFLPEETSYKLEVSSQNVLSHVFCVSVAAQVAQEAAPEAPMAQVTTEGSNNVSA